MLQSYDHSGEEMSRKRGMDQDDNAGKSAEGKSAKILRQEKDHTEEEEGGKEKNDNEDDNVDPPARERPAVSEMTKQLYH